MPEHSSASKPTTDGELLRGEAIICFSGIDWDFIWQYQEAMLRLAAAGNPVLFVENTGVRSPALSDLPRIISRLRNWWRGVHGFSERAPNLAVLSPLLLPFPYSRIARWINVRLLSAAIARWTVATKSTSPIVWTYLPTPLVHGIIDDLNPALVIYWCADNLAASSKGAREIRSSEREMFRRADLVFATAQALKVQAEKVRGEAFQVPAGVEFEKFEAFRKGALREPEDMSRIRHPRIGYVGGVNWKIDVPLLRQVALSRPDYEFVFVGPEQVAIRALKDLPNVHLLGGRPHDALPAYIQAFDVGLIPYTVDSFNSAVYPAKLNEYLAMGIPVVSTALPEVVRYNSSHGDVVRIGNDGADFLKQIGECLRDSSSGREARIDAARRNSWDERLRFVSSLIREKLASKRAEPKVVAGLIRRLTRRYQDLAAAGAFAALLSVAALRGTTIAWKAASFLAVSGSASPADAIVVLGGGAGETGLPGQGHEERITRAIQLYREGFSKTILLCSAARREFDEVDVMRAVALAKGIPSSAVLVEPGGGGTRRMVHDAGQRALASGWKRILLVSSPFHMKRALQAWHRQNPSIEAVGAPARSAFYDVNVSSRLVTRRRPTFPQLFGLLREAFMLACYRFCGWA